MPVRPRIPMLLPAAQMAMPMAAFMAALLVGSALPLCQARAADAAAPPLMPTRDVTVQYSVLPEGAPQPQIVRVYFKGGGGLMRIDGPPGPPDGSPSGFMVMNRAAHTMTVILNQQHAFVDIPEGQMVSSPFVLDSSMRFTPVGTGTVAGLACTRYSIVAGSGQAQACVTADGVVLSESGVDGQGNRGSLTAQSVSYGPLAASLFTPPPGFQRAAHPASPGEPGALQPNGPTPGAPGMPSGQP